MKLIALTTCHNRREKTLASVGDLLAQQLPDGTLLDVHIVDDGSADGTADAIRERFPAVTVHQGTGDLYWAGGMRFGYEQVCDEDFDALVVFNDDIRLNEGALANLMACSAELADAQTAVHAVCGSLIDSTTGDVTYGGYRRTSRLFPLRHERVHPASRAAPIDTFNMNFALIRREALDAVGFLAGYFRHSEADIEFGHRLQRAGGECWLAPGTYGKCARNAVAGTFYEPGISRLERLRRFNAAKAWPFRQRLRYCREYGGWLWPAVWLAPYVKIVTTNRLVRR